MRASATYLYMEDICYCMVKWLAVIHGGKGHAFRINVPNNWSSRPAFVTVKSTKVTLADNSGV